MASIRKGNARRRNAACRAAILVSRGVSTLVPNGFEPRHAEIGDFVKIGFKTDILGDEQREWMWAKVVAKDGDAYRVTMTNTSFCGNVFAGQRYDITSANILTTYENCPMRAGAQLAHLAPGQGWNVVLHKLYEVEAELGLKRRDAVAHMLANEDEYRVALAA